MAIFQVYVPADMQGRVFTVLLSSVSLMTPLGLALGGPLADAAGVPAVFIAAGVGSLLTAAAWSRNRTVMHLEDRPPPVPQVVE